MICTKKRHKDSVSAAMMKGKYPGSRVYFCGHCLAWHHTTMTKGELKGLTPQERRIRKLDQVIQRVMGNG